MLAAPVAAHADNVFYNVNNQLTASIGGHHLNYKESTDQYSSLDSETGTQVAYQVHASIQQSFFGINDIYLSATVAYSKGNTDYNGYLEYSDGRMTPYQSTTKDKTTDIDIKLGKALALSSVLQVIPYVFYGSHNWIRDSSDDAYGYYEHYRHQSVGVGAIAQYAITPRLVASIDGAIGRTFGAKMTASNVTGTFQLGSATTASGEIGIDYALTRRLHLNATYRITHFSYGQSKVVDMSYYEPDSKTTEQTFLVGIGGSGANIWSG